MKLRIDNRELVEEFFQDSRMIGIVAPLKAYHFCWLLNNELRIDFRTSGELEIQLEKKNRKYFFLSIVIKILFQAGNISFTRINLMVNICYRNINTLILYGFSRKRSPMKTISMPYNHT